MTTSNTTKLSLPKGHVLTTGSIGGLPVIRAGEDQDPRFNCMVYGYPGSGKTRLAGSCDLHPDLRPVLFIDYEAGIKPIRKLYPEVQVVSVTSWMSMQDVYADLFNDLRGYRTIIIDTGSELQKLAMEETMAKVVEEDPSRDVEVPSPREYLINLAQMRKMIRAFRDLPVNFICNVHAQDEKDQRTGRVQKKPDMSGRMANQIAGYFDVVLYSYVLNLEEDGSSRFVALSTQANNIIAKDRSGNLPQIIGLTDEQPLTMKYIYDTYTYGDRDA